MRIPCFCYSSSLMSTLLILATHLMAFQANKSAKTDTCHILVTKVAHLDTTTFCMCSLIFCPQIQQRAAVSQGAFPCQDKQPKENSKLYKKPILVSKKVTTAQSNTIQLYPLSSSTSSISCVIRSCCSSLSS